MAEFIVRNSLNPEQVVRLAVTLRRVIPKEPGFDEGGRYWVLEVGTGELGVDGAPVSTEMVYLRSSVNIDLEISKAVAEICSKLSWDTGSDEEAPCAFIVRPESFENVSLGNTVIINLRDVFPSSGIDWSSIRMWVNGVPVAPEITGDPFNTTVIFVPRVIN